MASKIEINGKMKNSFLVFMLVFAKQELNFLCCCDQLIFKAFSKQQKFLLSES